MQLSILVIFLLSITITTATKLPTTSSTILQSTTPNYNTEIINELKDFLDLIPQTTIDEIVAKHFITDGDFRHAIKFLRSNDFKQLIQRAEEIPEILEILNFLHLIIANTSSSNQQILKSTHITNDATWDLKRRILHLEQTIDNIPVIIELLAVLGENADDRQQLRSFTSFVAELLDHLPRDSYVNMIKAKCQKNAEFTEFYKALRSPSLQQMADAAMKTTDVTSVVRTLNSNKIDVKELEPIILKVISWGPII